MIELSTRLVRKSEILASELEDELMMMDLDTNNYFALDPVANHIWQLLVEPLTAAELCARLGRHFEVDEETCRRDTLAFLRQMWDEKLIQVV